MHKSPDLISTVEALEILGLTHRSTLTRWVAEKKVTPAMKLPGIRGPLLFNRKDIEAIALQRAA